MKKILLTAFVLLIFIPAFAEDIPVYTEQNLEKYIKPEDKTIPLPESELSRKVKIMTEKTENAIESLEKDRDRSKYDYYCRWGTYHQNEVDRYKDRVEEAKKELSSADGGLPATSWRRSLDVEYAKKRLYHAERDLKEAEKLQSQFQAQAHREDIPPGWLRCQF